MGNFETDVSSADLDGGATDDSRAALRTVIRLTLRTDLRRIIAGCPIEESGLRENLRAIGSHARRHRLRAEQLLILLKEVSNTLPETRELMATPEKAHMLAQVITMAVDEYYAMPGNSPTAD
jgi:hypothetical protein